MTVVRLTRMGRKKKPFYRIVVTDSRKRRDGGWIESRRETCLLEERWR